MLVASPNPGRQWTRQIGRHRERPDSKIAFRDWWLLEISKFQKANFHFTSKKFPLVTTRLRPEIEILLVKRGFIACFGLDDDEDEDEDEDEDDDDDDDDDDVDDDDDDEEEEEEDGDYYHYH